MRPKNLNYILSSIESLKGVGPKLEKIINKLGIYKNIHFVWNIPNNIIERKYYENIHYAELNSLVTFSNASKFIPFAFSVFKISKKILFASLVSEKFLSL